MQRIEVVQDPECDAAWPEAILNILTVQTADGRQHTATVPYYTGHFKKPMSDTYIEDKFRRNTTGLLDESASRRRWTASGISTRRPTSVKSWQRSQSRRRHPARSPWGSRNLS